MKLDKKIVWMLVMGLAVFIPSILAAQMVLGQYADEAPAGTWNVFGITTAAGQGLGGSRFASTGDASAALYNPALLTGLDRLTAYAHLDNDSAEFYRYGPVNTGVLSSVGNLKASGRGLNGGCSLSLAGWTIALNLARLEEYRRPAASEQEQYNGQPYYQLDFRQSGGLQDFNLALAHRLFGRVSAGIAANFVFGTLQRDMTDSWLLDGETTSSRITQKLSGFYLNGGISCEFSTKLRAALVLRSTYQRKAQSTGLLQEQTPFTLIQINAGEKDTYRQPLAAGLGLSWQAAARLRLVGDLTWFNWSRYTATYFGESQQRNFSNTLVVSAGGEWRLPLPGAKQELLLRAGLRHDPQPMSGIASAYWQGAFGLGLRSRNLHVDAALALGRENGSGRNLGVMSLALTVGASL